MMDIHIYSFCLVSPLSLYLYLFYYSSFMMEEERVVQSRESIITRECLLELISTFLLSFFLIFSSQPSSNLHLSFSILDGLITFILTTLFTNNDGICVHLNPAISFSICIRSLQGLLTLISRCIGQFIGSLLGFLLSYSLESSNLFNDSLQSTPSSPNPLYANRTQMFFIETIFTCLICLPYLSPSPKPSVIAATRTLSTFSLLKFIGYSSNFFLQLNSCIISLISSPSSSTGLPFLFLSLFSTIIGSLLSIIFSYLLPLP